MTKVWVHSCTRTREQEFILKYFYFHLLSYRVDKTRFSSSGAARDCYVHLDVSPTFQFDLKKFLNVWNAILIYITLDVFVVNVLPCHVIHDEQRKNLDWETCAGHATRVGWSGKDYFLGVKAIPFNIYPPPPPLPPAPLCKAMENYIFGGVAALALLSYGVFLSPGVWGKNPDLTIPVGGLGQ